MEHCNFQNSGTCFITVICFQILHLYSTVNKTTSITTPSKDYTENFTYLYHNIGRISSHTYKNLATTRPTLSTHKHFQAPTLWLSNQWVQETSQVVSILEGEKGDLFPVHWSSYGYRWLFPQHCTALTTFPFFPSHISSKLGWRRGNLQEMLKCEKCMYW